MSIKIPDSLRREIASRAAFCCEYCRLPEQAAFFSFHVDHIISLRHGGKTEPGNLAFACPICNRNKGTDLGTLSGNPPKLTRFFNPRIDHWSDHFYIEQTGEIISKTEVGEATLTFLDFNYPDAVIERKKLLLSGIFSA
ncbi:MAG: HNH endonuclease [Lewinellaceae bacterium]|nr:HNH endonuclease [Lewinellaceae bacterium]